MSGIDAQEDVGEIVNRAQKEEKMEQALAKIGSTWETLEFQFSVCAQKLFKSIRYTPE